MIKQRIKRLEMEMRPEQKLVVLPAGANFDEVVQSHLEPGMTADDLIILKVIYDEPNNREGLDDEIT
mgnify:CR=1 FL=1